MSVPCIVRLSISDKHSALIITPLFDTQAPIRFGIHKHKRFCFQVTHKDIISSLKMVHGCRNM
jgi:hypothetical protein